MNQKTQKQKFTWRSFGPGLLLASAAIGGSHLISSTQAGAIYGWQLAIMIVLVNIFKYPFFRFGMDYTYDTGNSLIAGYAQKSKIYLWIYFILSLFATIVNIGAVALFTAVILKLMLPASLGLSITSLSFMVVIFCGTLLIIGHYQALDGITKFIVVILTLTTFAAVILALGKPSVMSETFVPKNAFSVTELAFIIALMGWMPAPIEFSAINSLWTEAKIRHDHTNHHQGLIDFNVGYIFTAVLALVFLSLGVLVQYGSGIEIQTKGGAYVGQLVSMYTAVIGDWSRPLVVAVAFFCIFGTTLTALDGYTRANAECFRLLTNKELLTRKMFAAWIVLGVSGGMVLITVFLGQLGQMLKFAMIAAFVSAPIFGLLNYNLVKEKEELSPTLKALSIAGLIFLFGFAVFYLLTLFGVIA